MAAYTLGTSILILLIGFAKRHRCGAQEGLQGQRVKVPPWYVHVHLWLHDYLAFPPTLPGSIPLLTPTRQEQEQPRRRREVQGYFVRIRGSLGFAEALGLRSIW